MTDDAALLRRYLDGSEAAFAELVHCHIGAVYGTALRIVAGDTHLANDVTQKVFTGLARKASSLVDRPVLVGWLYLSTQYEAAKAVRSEQRWRNREQKAQIMNEILEQGAPEPDWTALRPVLDQAMRDLKEGDRDALLLRFFQSRTLAEVGEMLGLSENAARMRVDRALDKLHGQLVRRGIKSTATALGVVLAGQLATAAPSTLAATVTSVALAGATSAAGAAIVFMGMTKIQIGIAATLVVAGGSTLWSEYQTENRLQAENSVLIQQSAECLGLKMENTRLEANTLAEESLHQQASAAEPLRAEEARLRKEIQKIVTARNGQSLAGRQVPAAPMPRASKSSTTVDGQRIYRLSELDERPVPTEQHDPNFPEGLKMEGSATVSCVIRPDGTTSELEVEQASSDVFGEATKKALEKWKFKPAIKAGQPVNSRVTVPFKVGLNQQTVQEWL